MQPRLTELSRLARGFLSVSAGNYGAIGLSLAINVLLTRRLGAQAFGHLALLIMVSQVLSFFVANWTLSGLIRFGAQEFATEGKVAKAMWARTVVLLPWLLTATVLLIMFGDRAAEALRISTGGLGLVFLYFLAANVLTTCGALLQSCQRMGQYAVALFGDKLLLCLALLLLPETLRAEPLAVVACYAGSSMVVAAWALYALGPSFLRPVRMDGEAIRAMWRFSLPLIATTWVSLLGTYWIDYIVIAKFLSLSDLGLYSLANQIAGVVQQVTIISSTILLPHFSVLVARNDQEAIRAFVSRMAPYGFLSLSVLLGLFILHAGPVIPLVFGAAFAGSVAPLTLLMIATILLGFYNTFTPLLNAQAATWSLMWITLPTALVNAVADLLLVPVMGINGAAVSTILAYGVSAGLVLYLTGQRVQLPLLRYAVLGLPVVAVVACSFLLHGLQLYIGGLVVLGVATYAVGREFGLLQAKEFAAAVQTLLPGWARPG